MTGLTELSTIGSNEGTLAFVSNPESVSPLELLVAAAFGIGASGLAASAFTLLPGTAAFNATGD